MRRVMEPVSQLDDPVNAAFAWARYRRLMRWMSGCAVLATISALTILHLRNGPMSIHFYIAAGAGIFVSVLLGAALMGLVFLSAGTGHDDAITDRLGDRRSDGAPADD
jgi:hypothetical protein